MCALENILLYFKTSSKEAHVFAKQNTLLSYGDVANLLNLDFAIHISDPGQEKVIAPIVRFKHSSDELTRLSAVLLPLEELEGLFLRYDKFLLSTYSFFACAG